MVYDPDLPQPRDILSVSQADLLENFTQLNTQFGVNHVTFNDTTPDVGKHKFVTFVQQANVPETKADEYLIFSQDDAGTPELYARPESNGTEFQLTKGGSLFAGIVPFAAVNFNFAGTVQGTALNVAAGGITQIGGVARYQVNFTTPTIDNNYFWSVSGFDSSANPVLSQPINSANYATTVDPAFIQIEFFNQNSTVLTQLTGASLICWRVQ